MKACVLRCIYRTVWGKQINGHIRAESDAAPYCRSNQMKDLFPDALRNNE